MSCVVGYASVVSRLGGPLRTTSIHVVWTDSVPNCWEQDVSSPGGYPCRRSFAVSEHYPTGSVVIILGDHASVSRCPRRSQAVAPKPVSVPVPVSVSGHVDRDRQGAGSVATAAVGLEDAAGAVERAADRAKLVLPPGKRLLAAGSCHRAGVGATYRFHPRLLRPPGEQRKYSSRSGDLRQTQKRAGGRRGG